MDADAYRAWKETTFGSDYMIWHDGLDTSALVRLEGAQREVALSALRVGMAMGDPHAASALAAMGERDARGAVLEALAKAHGAAKVRLALAAHAMVPDPELAAPLVAVLESAAHWGERIDAAIGLARFSGEADERALALRVAGDDEYLVRYHAASSLLARWKIEPSDVGKHRDLLACIASPDRARHVEALSLLTTLARR